MGTEQHKEPVPCYERAERLNISIQSATSKIVGVPFLNNSQSDLLWICINHGRILTGEFHLVRILIGITNACVNKGRILTVGGVAHLGLSFLTVSIILF